MRYIPHTGDDKGAMLETLGYTSVDELFADIPQPARLESLLDLPPALSELELQEHMAELAENDQDSRHLVSFLGAGFYDRFIPAAIAQIVERGEFLTAYTPYQAELSQGTLAAIFEFQTMIAGLCGMYAAQASMYDGASAVGEAALLALGQTGRAHLVVSRYLHPDSLGVVGTYAHAHGAGVSVVDSVEDLEKVLSTQETAGVIWQYPDIMGSFTSLPDAINVAHRFGALAIVSSDPVVLSILKPPGEWEADIVVGEGQPLGNHLNYGGPTFGFFAVTEQLVRKLPGRLVGQSYDHLGHSGFVLTLQAREQHIRRERATSNICSNHSLNALQATIYMALLGPDGLKHVAGLSMAKAHYLAQALAEAGCLRVDSSDPFLYEFVVKVPGSVAALNRYLLSKKILGGMDMGQWDKKFEGLWQIAVTEKRSRAQLDQFVGEVKAWMSR